jgi:hypothetical protein
MAGLTMFWFSRVAAPTNLPSFNPLVASNWTRAITLVRNRLTTYRPDLNPQVTSKAFGATTASSSAFAQYVSDPLADATPIAGSFQFVMDASQATNETANLTLNIRVVKPDGTQRGLYFHGYLPPAAPSPDPVDIGTGAQTTTRLLAGTGTTVVPVAGDRLVVEIGFTTTGTSLGTSLLSYGNGASDAVPDMAFVRDQAPTGNAWLAINTQLYFAPDAPLAVTRLYLSAVKPFDAGISPTLAVNSQWTRSLGGLYRRMMTPRKADASDIVSLSISPLGSSATGSLAFGQWCSSPLDRDQTLSGTMTIVLPAWEQLVTENSYLAAVVRVITPANTERARPGFVVSQTGLEFATTPTERKQVVTLSTTACLKGDRLCVEVGVYSVTPGNTSMVALTFGATSLRPDAIGDETSVLQTSGWVEFSQVLTFDSATFLALFDPGTSTTFGVEWPLSVVVGTFQETTDFGGSLRRGFGRNLLSSQRGGKRAWRATCEFTTSEAFEGFLNFIDAAPGANVATGVRIGSKVLQLYSDAGGALRTAIPQLVRVDVGQATAFEWPIDTRRNNIGWSVDLTFQQV